jgi:hypothetical protein
MDILKHASSKAGTHNQAMALGIAQYHTFKNDERYQAMRADEATAIRLYYQIENLQDDIEGNLANGMIEASEQSDEKRKKHISAVVASHKERIATYKAIYFELVRKHADYARQNNLDLFQLPVKN